MIVVVSHYKLIVDSVKIHQWPSGTYSVMFCNKGGIVKEFLLIFNK